MPRRLAPPPTFYPLTDLPHNLPNSCSYCHTKFRGKTSTWMNPRFVDIGKDTFAYICKNCAIDSIHKPDFYNKYGDGGAGKPYLNTNGQQLLEVYDGIKLFSGNDKTVIMQVEIPNIREGRYGISKMREMLQMFLLCECCGQPAAHLETHHWFEPPKYEYHTVATCADCNQRHLSTIIWTLHPKYAQSKWRPPSHVMPSWELQKLYLDKANHQVLSQLLGEKYAYPPPPPEPASRWRKYIDCSYWR